MSTELAREMASRQASQIRHREGLTTSAMTPSGGVAPTPHSKRWREFSDSPPCGDVTGDRRINISRRADFHVPGQGHRPENRLA